MEGPLSENLGGRAISEQDEITVADKTLPPKKRRWYLRGWAWGLWGLLLILLTLALIAGWAWTKRYALMESYVIDALAEAGFEADLDIKSVTRTRAVVRNIHLKQKGADIIRVGELRADYVWPDIRDGKLLRLELDKPDFTLRLDENWKPSDPWLVDLLADSLDGSDGETNTAGFPEKGVAIKDGTLTVISPLGTATLYTDSDITAADDFSLALTLAPSDLSYNGFAAKGAGVVELDRSGDSLTIDGQVQTDRLSNGRASLRDAFVRMDGTLDLETYVYEGLIGVDGTTVDIAPFAADAVQLNWDGEILPGTELSATGAWEISAGGARISDTVRAGELADTLSLYPALSVVPVTEHYAPEIKRTISDFLTGTDLSAQGQLDYGSDGFTLAPSAPVTLKTAENMLTLSPIAEQDFYRFNRDAETIQARLDARFTKPVGLALRDINFNAASSTGYTLDGIESFTARVGTTGNWRATAATGARVRLGPLSTRVNYLAGEANPRRLSLDTSLDYDGPLPGGRVEKLGLQGRLDVRLYETRQALDFTPRKDSRLTMDRLETPTEWIAEGVSFGLPATQNIFVRTQAKSTIKAALQSPDFILTRPPNATSPDQRIDMSAREMVLDGTLNPNGTQDWTVNASDTDYSSDTLPGPGTTAQIQTARLTANLTPDAPVQVTLNSDAVIAATPLVEISNMAIAMEGTPETYTVIHSGGTVKLIGSAAAAPAQAAGLATLPAEGRVTFAEGRFTGQAKLQVAKANNAQVDVDYSYADGAGLADIDIPSVKFDPNGLQPLDLVPALRGKVSRVTGEARAQLHVEFADGALTDSDGNLDLLNMDIATAPGPLSGVNTSIRFDSLWPIQTVGTQTLTMKSFNPGFELKDGVMSYRLIPDGVIVDEARWPIGRGGFSLDPFTWRYAADENRVVMRVEDIALGDFLEDFGNSKVEATGNVVGTFPIVIRGVQVLVDSGEISVPNGGVIKYDSGLPGRTYTQEEALEVFKEKRSDEYSAVAQDALKEFNYRSLSAAINGPLDGEVSIGMVFDGSNPKVLNSQPFQFDIKVKGELLNIARSFNSNAQIKSEVLKQTGLVAK